MPPPINMIVPSLLALKTLLPAGRHPVGRPQLGQLALAVLVHGQDALRASRSHLALNGGRGLEPFQAGGLPEAGSGLLLQTPQGLLLIGPEVVPWVNPLPQVDTSLVGTLVYPGFERVQNTVRTPVCDSPKITRRR